MSPGPGRWLATALQRTEWMIRAIALAALALWSLVAYGGGSPRLVLAPSPDRDLTARATLRALTPDAR